MSYNTSTHKRLTAIEVYRRLRAVKRQLANKNQLLVNISTIERLHIDLTPPDQFYIAPISFDDAAFYQAILKNKSLFDLTLFRHRDLKSYVMQNRVAICRNFSIVSFLFTKYRRQDVIHKHAIICIGSIYHAPRIFYKDKTRAADSDVIYEKAFEYVDLH